MRFTVHSKVAFACAASLGTPVAIAVGHGCPASAPVPATRINIPAQPLGSALQALAAETGLDILFEPSTVTGLQAAAIHGELRPSDALCLLLGELGLAYSINPDHTVIVTRSKRVPGIPAGGSTPNQDAISNVIVTGTRRADRSVADSLVPITVISGESVFESGSIDLAQTLSQLLPSFNYPRPSLTDGTDFIRPATLRGLQPDEMLVLVNGKRRHSSALLNINTTVGRGATGVDMSMLPAAAIDRIEVLSDGAAAQYGSDAIAGVVNVLLKSRRDGADVNVTYGQTYTDIKGVHRATGVVTQPDGQPVVMSDGVYALRYDGDREAHDGQTVSVSASLGLPLGPQGYLDIAARGRDQSPTNRSGYDPQQQYPLTASGRADPRELTFNRLSQQFGEPRIQDATLSANAGLPLGDSGVEWYAFGTAGTRYGLTAGVYRTADDLGTVTSIYPDGFLPRIKADISDGSVVTGVRGTWDDWHYDGSANYGRDGISFETENSDNSALGAASPTAFQDGGMLYQQYLLNLDAQRAFVLPVSSRPLSAAWGLEYRNEHFAISPGDPASYASTTLPWGSFQQGPVSGQVFPGFRPDNVTDRGRHSSSAYLDLEQDLNSRWTVALAGRAEHYSDFGSSFNYKLATRVVLADGVALRGSATTGFKAPSLQQQFFSTVSTNEVNGRLVNVGTFAVSERAARVLGATDLRAEKSHNLGAGIMFNRIQGLDITVDWYRIAITDRIVLSENLGTDGLQSNPVKDVLAAAGYPGICAARFFINGVDTLTQGFDVVSTYRVPFQLWGDWRLSAGFNDTQTRITRYIENLDPQLQIPGLILFGPTKSKLLTRGQPRSKLNLAAQWSWRDLGATVRTNHYGSVLSPAVDSRDDLWIQPAWVTDVELRYSPAAWRFALGTENIFDKYPTLEPTGARSAGLGGAYSVQNYYLPFSELSPFGFSGRFVYGRIGYRF